MVTRRKFIGLLAALPGVNYGATAASTPAAGADTRITHAKIHPALGIARVGNSRDEFFLGPEVPEAPALPAGSYKDKTGALKRQAAQFRLYGYNAAGEVVQELTPEYATIAWTVHLANKKAAWYEFQMAMDILEASLPGAASSHRRNPEYAGAARKNLIIDPGPRTIRGKSTRGAAYQFDTGKFLNLDVPLGELRTTEQGRLLVLGGFGLSRSVTGQAPEEYGNNNGWHDDISDGPVDAKVTMDNREVPVEGAWVVVAPPNYAPALKTVRTLYDLVYDCSITWGLRKAPDKVYFSRHIAPIFRRLSGLQWVNQGFAAAFGFGAADNAEQIIPRLADAAESNRPYRQEIYAHFRNPAERRLGKALWPMFYGDAVDSFTEVALDPTLKLERGMSALSGTQLGWLEKWAAGDFISDLAGAPAVAKTLEDIPLAEQPAALDEAALSFCIADAFHPGCEITWIARRRNLYDGALRIRRRPAGAPERDYGDILLPAVAIGENGPLTGAGPGDLTRWMAVPWQTDTADCLWSYDFFRMSDSLPTYWPARVPNQVLSEADYNVAMDATRPLAQRQAAFNTRRNWFRGLTRPNAQMVTDFHKLGVIEERPGPTGIPQLPSLMLVESRPALPLPEYAPPRAGRRAQ